MIYAVLIFALGLRLINLNQSLWLDEAFQFKSTYFFSLKDLLTVYLSKDFNPPLSYLINFFFGRIFGYSEVALRLPSVIFGVLTIYIVYRLVQFWLKKPYPIIAALLIATSGLHLYYSQEARMYSLVTLAVAGSFYALLQKSWKKYLFFSLMAVYAHYLAVFIFPAQWLYIYLTQKKQLNKLVLSQLAVAVGFVPWLPIFISQLQTGLAASSASQQWSAVVGSLTPKALALIPIKFLIGRISIDNNFHFALNLILPLSLTAYLLYLTLKHFHRHKPMTLLLYSWLFLPLILIMIVSVKLPVLSYFRLIFLLPAFYLLLTLGASYCKKPLIVITALLAINFFTSAIYLFNPNFHRENWQDLTETLASRNLNQAPVLVIPVVDAPLRYYQADKLVATDNLDQVLDQPELWYVPYTEPIFDPDLTLRQKLQSAGFTQDYIHHFRGNLTLVKYIKAL